MSGANPDLTLRVRQCVHPEKIALFVPEGMALPYLPSIRPRNRQALSTIIRAGFTEEEILESSKSTPEQNGGLDIR